MKSVAIVICLGMLSIFTVARTSLASDVFPLPAGWREFQPNLSLLKRAAAMDKEPVERHVLLYVAPQRADGFVANIVVDTDDTPIDKQIAGYRTYLSRAKRQLVVDRLLQCQGRVRGQIFENVSMGQNGRSIDTTQMVTTSPTASSNLSTVKN